MNLTPLLVPGSATRETFEQTYAPEKIAACHELFFWPFFLVGFCTPTKHRTVVAWFHIWFLVPSEDIWISPGLPFPCATSDGAGKHTAQIRLAKSAPRSSAALTTQLYPKVCSKVALSGNYCQLHWIRTVTWRAISAGKKKHFWSENSREHC